MKYKRRSNHYRVLGQRLQFQKISTNLRTVGAAKNTGCGPGCECLGCNNNLLDKVNNDEDVSTDDEMPCDLKQTSPDDSPGENSRGRSAQR